MKKHPPMTILMADDDPDDCLLMKDAISECGLPCELYTVNDGIDLLKYLNRTAPYNDPENSPSPSFILLDLNMPKKDGRQTLKEIKRHAVFRSIPIIIFTTSAADEDVNYTYQNGAASYLIKPGNFESLVELVKLMGAYWLERVKLPSVVN